jgi:hypothetical protein
MLLPNFSTLLSLILTSKQVHTVFQTRPHFITCAVAYNQLGSVLPQALTLVRCRAAGLLQLDVSKLPEEADALRQETSREEIKLLARNVKVATELEDLFSWRYCPLSHPTITDTYTATGIDLKTEHPELACSHKSNRRASNALCIESCSYRIRMGRGAFPMQKWLMRAIPMPC